MHPKCILSVCLKETSKIEITRIMVILKYLSKKGKEILKGIYDTQMIIASAQVPKSLELKSTHKNYTRRKS
jgi:hypothetical protein